MKPHAKNWSGPLVLLLVDIGSVVMAQAQTLTTLHSFTGIDGFGPSGLILSQGILYGTTVSGGVGTNGTVFKLNVDGTGFTNLHLFAGGADGFAPVCSLVLSGNILYGTCAGGGSEFNGTVFALNSDGTGFTVLHSFTNGDGANPHAGLILQGDRLYGTTLLGGAGGVGTVFRLNTDGSAFTNLHSFTSDGPYPVAPLVSFSNTLYGTTEGLITGGNPVFDEPGTIFSVKSDGSGFTTLQTNRHPKAGLILLGNALYGTTAESLYVGDFGSVFKINTDGTGLSVLHNFTSTISWPQVNGDGTDPEAGLILSGGTLYGTCASGGSSGSGTIFAINTDGTGFVNLYSFSHGLPPGSYGSDGGVPLGSLVLSGNTLYGTAVHGGSAGDGTVFSLSLTPQLNIDHSSSNIVLSWPTNYAGFDYSGFTLQSATSLASPVWTNLAPQVVVDGQYIVTNLISGTQQFFRLSQ